MFKLAYFVTHPIQYQAPLLRMLAARPEIDLKVFFLSDLSVKSFKDKGFGVAVKWDIPLLDGYRYEFLPRIRDRGTIGFSDPLVYGVGQALRVNQWDAVWFHGYAHYALLWGIWMAVRLKIPVFFRAESNLVCTSRGMLKDCFIRWLLRHSSALLWISSDNRDYYLHYGASEKQLFFVPYAVDNQHFRKRSEEAKEQVPALKRELGLSEDLPVILYAGKLLKRKNPMLLLQAYRLLSQDGKTPPPVYLIYVGDGEERSTLGKSIVDLGWQSHVKVLGFKNQSQLPLYYTLCDLFVVPSHKEPFGLVINEAMNAGKAIISTNEVGASRDLVYDGINGFVVPAGNVKALSEALRRAISDKKRLQQMGSESLKIIDKWSFEQDVEGIMQALHAVRRM